MNADPRVAEDQLSSTLHRRKDWLRYFILRKKFALHRLAGRSYGGSEVYERRTLTGNDPVTSSLTSAGKEHVISSLSPLARFRLSNDD